MDCFSKEKRIYSFFCRLLTTASRKHSVEGEDLSAKMSDGANVCMHVVCKCALLLWLSCSFLELSIREWMLVSKGMYLFIPGGPCNLVAVRVNVCTVAERILASFSHHLSCGKKDVVTVWRTVLFMGIEGKRNGFILGAVFSWWCSTRRVNLWQFSEEDISITLMVELFVIIQTCYS